VRPERFTRVQEILLAVADLGEAERAVFLDQACKDDPDLRREVEALLARDGESTHLLKLKEMIDPATISNAYTIGSDITGRDPMDDFHGFGRQSVVIAVGAAGPGAVVAEAEEFAPAAEKYEIEGRIGGGGMGEVLLVSDKDLRRQVAMKVIRPRIAGEKVHRVKFVAEAQATSQLEHPGIPPVHDIGITREGRVWFTMKLVRGKTLAEILRDLMIGVRPVKREWTLHKLVSALEQVAQALHFAHEKGVVHRDLKPENIMLGDYGEVHVMDWGIAKLSTEMEEDAVEEAVETAEAGSGFDTVDGTLKGTIAYMSPEQARGRMSALDRRSDVYAMGTILYEMLTLHPAFDPGEGMAALPKVVSGEYVPVTERNPRRPVPESLADLCRRAMARDPADRPPTAEAFEDELRAWLDGRSEAERRHREAESLAEQGKRAAARFWKAKEEVSAAEDAAKAMEKDYKPFQPVKEKLPLIEARERVETLKTDEALAFAETVKLLEGALLEEEGNATARGALADLWKGRLEDAERQGNRADTAFAVTMVERYDDGRLTDFLRGDGTLTLTSNPPGAKVVLSRFVERNGVLVPEEERFLGVTPLEPVTLPMGSYLCVLAKRGYRDMRYPVHITRNRAWTGEVQLRTDEEVGEGFVHVPAGPFVHGEGKETEVREIGDFAIARYPVTFAEYGAFLASLPEEEAEERKPFMQGEGPLMERGDDGVWRPLPIIVEGAARDRCVREHGEDFETRIPVMAISWEDAAAYCAWKTRETGREWRLPTEEEREKAARGVDGRRFPWGDLEDASLGKCRESRDEDSQPEPVGTFPFAASVYGMGDAAGNVWDWTDSWFDARRFLRVVRGGSWFIDPLGVRCAFRYGLYPRVRHTMVGFRCARGL
jgi:serine/threonine protein kinase/formylglycine-generating enzyme required for sulfatase activity